MNATPLSSTEVATVVALGGRFQCACRALYIGPPPCTCNISRVICKAHGNASFAVLVQVRTPFDVEDFPKRRHIPMASEVAARWQHPAGHDEWCNGVLL